MHRTQSTKPDGRRTRHRHRRPELLKALTEHVLDNGFAGLSLRATANALGVTHSTLLRHFGSKNRLVATIIEEVCSDLVARVVNQVPDLRLPTDQILRGAWRQLCEPKEQRQFLLLFELTSLTTREPDRYGEPPKVLIEGLLGPIRENLRHNGWDPEEARALATTILAQIRGLQIDLAITGDQQRVDQAMHRYIEMIIAGR